MKAVAVVLFALVALCAATPYSYIEFYSNPECSEFRGAKGMIDSSVAFLSHGDGGSCGVELECMVNPNSRGCARIQMGDVTPVELIQRDDGAIEEYLFFAREPNVVEPDQCLKSPIYDNCWYRIVTSEAYSERLLDSCRAKFHTDDIIGDDDDSTNDYAYLTYYSSPNCDDSTFEAQRMITSEPITLTGVVGSSCADEMICFLDPASFECQQAHEFTDVSVALLVEVDVKHRITDEIENGVRNDFTSSNCHKSGLYSKCWFRYYTADEMETYSDGCDDVDGYSGAPSVSLGTTRDDLSALSGVTWFLGSKGPLTNTITLSPASTLQMSLLFIAAPILVLLF